MIIKSSARAGARELARHLSNGDENETIRITQSRGVFAQNLFDALDDMRLISKGSRCRKFLYHVSMSPEPGYDFGEEYDWTLSWQRYEAEFGLSHLAFVEVEHAKEGRTHRHRVYCRVGDDNKAVPLGFSKMRNEKVARQLEYLHGHPLTIGRHNKAVVTFLKREGQDETALGMEGNLATTTARPRAARTHDEQHQQQRTKIPVEQVNADVQAAWQLAQTGQAFLHFLLERGYILAQGDKRRYVILDQAGGVHSPRRRVGLKAAEVNEKLRQIHFEGLPTIEQVKEALSGFKKGFFGADEPGRGLMAQQQALLERFLQTASISPSY